MMMQHMVGGLLFSNVSHHYGQQVSGGIEIRYILKDTIQKQKFELYFPFSDTDCLMLKFPIDFKDNNIMHRYIFKQLNSEQCITMKSSSTDLHSSLTCCISSNKFRWQGIFQINNHLPVSLLYLVLIADKAVYLSFQKLLKQKRQYIYKLLQNNTPVEKYSFDTLFKTANDIK